MPRTRTRSTAEATALRRAHPRAWSVARPPGRRRSRGWCASRTGRARMGLLRHGRTGGWAADLAKRHVHGHRRFLHDILVIHVCDDADDAAGLWIPRLVHDRCRLSASPFGNRRCAMLWLTMATGSVSLRSSSVKSRPARIGTPSTAKNRGETGRNRASRVFFAIRGLVTLDCKLELEAIAAVAPGHDPFRPRHPARPATRRSVESLPGRSCALLASPTPVADGGTSIARTCRMS